MYEAYRARKDLKRRLIALHKSYTDAAPTAREGMRPLRDLFDDEGGPVPVEPDKAACQAEGKVGYVALWCRVRACRTVKDTEPVDVDVAAAEAQVANWRATDRAMRRLEAKFQQVPKPVRDGDDPFMKDTAEQLKGVDVPADAAATAKLTAAMENHAALIAPYAVVLDLYEKRGGGQDEWNPAKHYRERFPEDTAFAERTPGTMEAFEADLAELRQALTENRFPKRTALEADNVRSLLLFGDRTGSGSLRLSYPAVPDAPTAEQLAREIRRSDWVVSLITFVLVAAAYISTLYSGEAWGSQADYLASFAAGFGGQALAGVALAPFLRSAVGSAPAKAKAKAADA
jgi:hypothetical protein